VEASDWIWVYTDGACSGNPGPGGWGYCACRLQDDQSGAVFEGGGAAPATTNNRMEMLAVIEALRAIAARGLQHCAVTIITDSSLVVKGATEWVRGWKRKDWIKADGQPVMNRDLWEALEAQLALHTGAVAWRLVRGHSGLAGNERVDRIAVAFSKGMAFPLAIDVSLEDYAGRAIFAALPPGESLARSGTAGGARKAAPPKSTGPAYYISFILGKLERHATWADCERRVKGVSGARFRKVSSKEEEAAAVAGWRPKKG
jgi:ribonuclease HI